MSEMVDLEQIYCPFRDTLGFQRTRVRVIQSMYEEESKSNLNIFTNFLLPH
jgi:hypothetical protein